jgi:hypothetical protein
MNVSKYGYFWYAFLFGGLAFLLFFDVENFAFNGSAPEDKIQDLKNWYSRDSVPRAKEVSNTSNANILDEANKEENQVETEADDSNSKKSKVSFRNRKVSFLVINIIIIIKILFLFYLLYYYYH